MEKTFLLTFDLEEFDRVQGERRFELSHEGAERVIEILDRLDVSATFFTTASFARRYPNMVRFFSRNNEIALHAYEHSQNYRRMPPAGAENFLRMGRQVLEEITGEKVLGFRAPQMQAPEMPVLKKAGLSYDSSLHPTFVPGRYNGFKESRDVRVEEGIVRVPVSVTPVLRMAFSWLWFRALGVNYAKLCTRRAEKGMDYVCIYFHPWDFVDLRQIPGLPLLYGANTHKSPEMLEHYLHWLKERGYRFSTMADFLREKELL